MLPPLWVLRSEASLAAFCSALVSPSWGSVAVDMTDLLLHLTFHERNISWPTADALTASRELLESPDSGLGEEQLAAYPDVPVSEQLFMKLPLWDDSLQAQLRDEPTAEQADAVKSWIFRILLWFQDEAKPLLPSVSGGSSSATITARRLFTHLGLSTTPMAGLQLALKLMISPLPPPQAVEGEPVEGEAGPQILVQHLWTILFSRRGRSSLAAAPPPELADFCLELIPPEPEPDPAAAAPAGKPAKGAKGAPDPAAEAKPVKKLKPEEMIVAFDENLIRNKAVLRGLCTHGALFCRRRALAMLFPPATASVPSLALHDTAQAAAAQGLASLVPTPPPTAEEVPEGET